MKTRPLFLLGVTMLCILLLAESARSKELRVGTKPTEPFVLRTETGSWSGISIELWERIASMQGWTFTYHEMGLEDLLTRTSSGSLDVAVAAITVTPLRERSLDFTHAFHATGLGVAVSKQGEGWKRAMARLASPRFLGVVASLVLLLFAVGSLVWLFERRRNPGQFGGRPLQGMGAGFWWSAVTMTTVGYGDKAPVTVGGRLVALVWMFTAIIAISSITAAITSALTVSQLESRLAGPEDLSRVRVGTLQGTAAEILLRERGIASTGYPDMARGLEALRHGEIDAFVYDEPILRHGVLHGFQGTLQVLPWVFARQDYAFVLPPDSSLRESINRSLLEILHEPAWEEVLIRYLGAP